MSNKELKLKGRVQNKHKTEAEWYLDVYKAAGSTELRDDPFIPLNGELIIYDPDSVYTERRLKIGDGVTNVVTLSFYQGNPAELLTESKKVVSAINEINSKTVDKITDISFTSGTISSVANEGDGIYWEYKETEIQVGDDLHYVDNVSNKVPIISGENINLEVDNENQVVKINAENTVDKIV